MRNANNNSLKSKDEINGYQNKNVLSVYQLIYAVSITDISKPLRTEEKLPTVLLLLLLLTGPFELIKCQESFRQD